MARGTAHRKGLSDFVPKRGWWLKRTPTSDRAVMAVLPQALQRANQQLAECRGGHAPKRNQIVLCFEIFQSPQTYQQWTEIDYIYMILYACVSFLVITLLFDPSCLMPRRKARWLSLAAWASGSLQRWFFSSQNHFIVFFHEHWLLGTLPHLGYKRGSDGYNLVRGINQFSLSVRSCHSAENMVKSGIHCTSRPTRLDTCSAKCWPLSEAPRVQLHLGFTSLREVVCRMAYRKTAVKSNASTLSWAHEFITYPNNLAACDTLPVACFCSFSARVYHVTRFCSADIKNMWNHLKSFHVLEWSVSLGNSQVCFHFDFRSGHTKKAVTCRRNGDRLTGWQVDRLRGTKVLPKKRWYDYDQHGNTLINKICLFFVYTPWSPTSDHLNPARSAF